MQDRENQKLTATMTMLMCCVACACCLSAVAHADAHWLRQQQLLLLGLRALP